MNSGAKVETECGQGGAKTLDVGEKFSDAALRRQMLYAALAQVPHGRVVTYGQLAQLAGLGRAARWGGTQLSRLPDAGNLPWHRVINAAGRLSLTVGSEAWTEQCQRLRSEGIQVSNGRVSLRLYRWHP